MGEKFNVLFLHILLAKHSRQTMITCLKLLAFTEVFTEVFKKILLSLVLLSVQQNVYLV